MFTACIESGNVGGGRFIVVETPVKTIVVDDRLLLIACIPCGVFSASGNGTDTGTGDVSKCRHSTVCRNEFDCCARGPLSTTTVPLVYYIVTHLLSAESTSADHHRR